MNFCIEVKHKTTKQIYKTGKDFYVFGILLTKSGVISDLIVFNKDTGMFETEKIQNFTILQKSKLI